jgi:glycosyltransferase involved in cell wall biosynthesis
MDLRLEPLTLDPRRHTAPSESDAPRAEDLELSIVMPCLNEAETVGACVATAVDFLHRHGIEGEVIVADNGSTDASRAVAAREGARIVDVPSRGYGAALQAGIAAARGSYVIIGDSDGSYDFAQLTPFLAALRGGAQLVMGNRFSGRIYAGAMPGLHRYLGNPLLSFMGRLFFKNSIGDYYCGLRGFSRDAILALDLRMTGMEFAIEMVVRAVLARLKIVEIPTTLSRDGRSGPSHLRTWRDGWRTLRFLLLYSPQWLFLYPGLTLIVLGLGTALMLLPGPLPIGHGVILDLHTMLVACAACVVGVQSVCFALIARDYAVARKLIPPSSRNQQPFRTFTLERLLILGGAIFLGGIAGLVWALLAWSEVHFGDLGYSRVIREVILPVTALSTGAQLILSGFLAGVIAIGHRD